MKAVINFDYLQEEEKLEVFKTTKARAIIIDTVVKLLTVIGVLKMYKSDRSMEKMERCFHLQVASVRHSQTTNRNDTTVAVVIIVVVVVVITVHDKSSEYGTRSIQNTFVTEITAKKKKPIPSSYSKHE